MSFWQKQQIKAAVRYLRWQFEKAGQPVPEQGELERRAAALVDEAGRIAGRTGRNVLGIVRDLIKDLKK